MKKNITSTEKMAVRFLKQAANILQKSESLKEEYNNLINIIAKIENSCEDVLLNSEKEYPEVVKRIKRKLKKLEESGEPITSFYSKRTI